MQTPTTIGLIAGNGKFPLLFARAAREQNIRVVTAAIRGDTSFLLQFLVPKMVWFSVGDLQKLFDYFKSEGVSRVIMAGQVNPQNLFDKNIKMENCLLQVR